MEIDEIISEIDKSVSKFNESMPAVQRQLFDEINELTTQLQTKKGRIVANAKNIRIIGQIKQKFDKLITKNKAYKNRVKEFTDSFAAIEKLQNQYFAETVSKYSPPKTLAAIRQESVNATVESLRGVSKELAEPIREILRTNITSGAKFTDLTKTLREFMLDTPQGEGRLVKHVKQITTDALNQYARTNIALITDDLGLEWYSYNGALIATSRDFCKALIKKKYIHKSEFPKVVKGDFKEFQDIDGKISDKTKLPYGMIEGTNAQTLVVNCGGYQCNHELIPVDELVVPQSKRDVISS